MDKVFIIGIAGGSGSGKTTFSKKVIECANTDEVTILHMDSYYLPIPPKNVRTDKGNPNFDHPMAFDWDLLRYHLSELKAGRAIEMPLYDFSTNRRINETHKIGPAKVVLFEGIFTLFDEEIRQILDIKCFLHVDSDIRFTRRLHRDVKERDRSLESVIGQYYETVRPMYEKYLSPQRQHADFVVGEETDVAAKILAASVKDVLSNTNMWMNLKVNKQNETQVHN